MMNKVKEKRIYLVHCSENRRRHGGWECSRPGYPHREAATLGVNKNIFGLQIISECFQRGLCNKCFMSVASFATLSVPWSEIPSR
jgi:hypothetical protein